MASKEAEDADGGDINITRTTVFISVSTLNEVPAKRSPFACQRIYGTDVAHDKIKGLSMGQMLVSPLGLFLTDTGKVSQWVQLAGHKGDFITGHPGTICKRCSDLEKAALESLMDDVLKPFVPLYFRELLVGAELTPYLEMQDLLLDFDVPTVMDVKMGVRTFLESEVTKMSRRMDLLEKMIAVDPKEPSDEEKEKGITKLRYMQFRERESSSVSLGFRVEGIKTGDNPPITSFKKVKSRESVKKTLFSFLPDPNSSLFHTIRDRFVRRLRELRATLQQSPFFATHEFIGSSLLFIYDHTGKTGIWLIDFGKTSPVDIPVTHAKPWELGNREDGYLIGLDNLTEILMED